VPSLRVRRLLSTRLYGDAVSIALTKPAQWKRLREIKKLVKLLKIIEPVYKKERVTIPDLILELENSVKDFVIK
jgi:hypothetical protein